MSEEQRRQQAYNELHRHDELRFPKEDYPAFCDWLNIPRGGAGLRLLDIACGQGFFLEAAAVAAPELQLSGVDFSSVALELAARRAPRAELQLGSAYELPYLDEQFDYCVNLGSMEHFDAPERAVGEMARVLKPTGKAMVIVPNQYYLGSIWRALAYGESEEQGQEGLTHFRTTQEWKRLFLENGLDVLGIQGYNGEDHIAWYFKRPDGRLTDAERQWRLMLNTFVKPLIPLNLSQCFVVFLRRQM
jgi:SAM-dependent methyltransferase